jgi:RRXRR protein
MQVAVIDQNRRPLAPTSEVRARLLLKKGKAAVFRRARFTIILKHVIEEVHVPDLRLKLDPGSRKTGVAIVNQNHEKKKTKRRKGEERVN